MESQQKEQLKDLHEIRSLMERSSQFISLSGLSGIFAGIFALFGASAVYIKYSDFFFLRYNSPGISSKELLTGNDFNQYLVFLFSVGFIVLVLAVTVAIYFTTRNARRKHQSIWDNTAKRLVINTFIPLLAGGIFCIALLYHGLVYLIAPSTLVFYGLALLNGSKYTLSDIRYLGICEIVLGLISLFFVGYGLVFWAIGFGVLHIIYGSIMYMKYER